MLLAVNIGNTNISFAFFKAQKIKTCWDIPLRDYSKSRLAKRLTVNKISAALICSVVPGLSSELIAALKGYLARPFFSFSLQRRGGLGL